MAPPPPGTRANRAPRMEVAVERPAMAWTGKPEAVHVAADVLGVEPVTMDGVLQRRVPDVSCFTSPNPVILNT